MRYLRDPKILNGSLPQTHLYQALPVRDKAHKHNRAKYTIKYFIC